MPTSSSARRTSCSWARISLTWSRLAWTRSLTKHGRGRPNVPFPRPEALLSEVLLLLGTDGQMRRSRAVTRSMRMSAYETAKILKKARLTERRITFDRVGRPEVLPPDAGSGHGRHLEAIADRIGDAGAGTLKALARVPGTNASLLRERRAELIANEDHSRPSCR